MNINKAFIYQVRKNGYFNSMPRRRYRAYFYLWSPKAIMRGTEIIPFNKIKGRYDKPADNTAASSSVPSQY